MDVWVEEPQWVLWDVVRGHHLVLADDIWQSDGCQLLLGVGLHSVEHCFVVDIVLHPGEGDSSLSAALAEAQKEGPGTLVVQHGFLALLADKAHDATVVPQGEQVSLDEIEDPFNPQPEGKALLAHVLTELRPWDQTLWIPCCFRSQELVCQHAQLLLVEPSLGDRGELPAQHLGQLAPVGRGWAQEELEVLGFGGQHVVPQNGGPATGQLADVGDDHDRQGDGLEFDFKP